MKVILGRRIYYNKLTSEVVYDMGERVGEDITETTIEEDFKFALELQGKNPEIIKCIQLEPGEYSNEFAECVSYRINPETEEIEFIFDDTGDSGVYEKPYKQQLEDLKQRLDDTEIILSELLLGI